MTLCSICCTAESKHICDICDVDICQKCNTELSAPSLSILMELCNLCYSDNFTYHNYCRCCDEVVMYKEYSHDNDKCYKCVDLKITIENRITLPHLKAKPLINAHLIPEITQIIFDYYYLPRRYYPGEF